MDTALLFQTINSISPISTALEERITGFLKEEKLKKKYLLLKEGQQGKRIYFINRGFARAYYRNKDKEYTTWFMGTGDFMISVYSFFTQKPAVETIEILEDSYILSITMEQLQTVYKEFPEYNLVGRILTEQYYIKSEERAIALRTLTAADRYESLIKAYPSILQKAALGHIASHLGISQETLSRIRSSK